MPTNNTTVGYVPVNKAGDTMTGLLVLSGDPVAALGAVTKQYADAIGAGLDVKAPTRVATTVALTVTYSNGVAGVGATLTNAGAQAALTIDGVALSVNNRVLIKNQAATLQNGIYFVTNIGSGVTNWILTRSTDYDQVAEIFPGNLIIVTAGTTQANTSWIETATVTAIGTDPITFIQFSSTPLTLPLAVTQGGTGVATLTTAYGTLAAGTTATGNVQTVAPGTTGQALVSAGAAALPAYGTLPVAGGGTGVATLTTAYGTLVAGTTATGAVQTVSPGTTGQALVSAGAASVPAYGTLPVAGGGTGVATLTTAYGTLVAGTTATGAVQTVSPGTSGQALVSAGAASVPAYGTLGVTGGGTGVATLTTPYGVLTAGTTATGAVQTLAALGAAATVLTSNGPSALPSFQALPAASGYPFGAAVPSGDYLTGGSWPNQYMGGTAGSASPLNTQMYFVPMLVPATQVFTTIGIYLSTAAAAQTLVLGLYTSNAALNAPTGNVITNSNSGSLSMTAGGDVTYTFASPITLTAGLYWGAVAISGGSPVFAVTDYTSRLSSCYVIGFTTRIAAGATNPIMMLRQAFTYSTTFPTIGSLTTQNSSGFGGAFTINMIAQ